MNKVPSVRIYNKEGQEYKNIVKIEGDGFYVLDESGYLLDFFAIGHHTKFIKFSEGDRIEAVHSDGTEETHTI